MNPLYRDFSNIKVFIDTSSLMHPQANRAILDELVPALVQSQATLHVPVQVKAELECYLLAEEVDSETESRRDAAYKGLHILRHAQAADALTLVGADETEPMEELFDDLFRYHGTTHELVLITQDMSLVERVRELNIASSWDDDTGAWQDVAIWSVRDGNLEVVSPAPEIYNSAIADGAVVENEPPNVHKRIPICLCLDVSASMSGDPEKGAAPDTTGIPIDYLNAGVQRFYTALKEYQPMHGDVDIAVVTFSSEAMVLRDFESAAEAQPPYLELELERGGTSLGAGVGTAMELITQREMYYRELGIEYMPPRLVILTDGQPTDRTHDVVAPSVAEHVEAGRLEVYPFGIGSFADLDALATFSPVREPMQLEARLLPQLFDSLSGAVVDPEASDGSTVDESMLMDLSIDHSNEREGVGEEPAAEVNRTDMSDADEDPLKGWAYL